MDFERLANRHKDAVYRQMVRVCGNREDAEDALAEALLGAYRASETLRSEEAFRVWLATIGRRVCLRIRKTEQLAPILALSEVDMPSTDDTDATVGMNQMKGCIEDAVMSLPEIYRDTYILREIEGLPAEEVGKSLDISVTAVKSRLHRARKLVRENLDRSLCVNMLN